MKEKWLICSEVTEPERYQVLCLEWSFERRWSIKGSDLLMILAAFALLKPCFFKNKVNTAFASSFSAANKVGGNPFTFNDSFVPK
jgi:hypothetical protein